MPTRNAMTPTLLSVDHVHVFVSDRPAAESWYERVMGLRRVPELEFWATDGGPLTMTNSSGSIHLALFERPNEKCRSTVAFGADAKQFIGWQEHLRDTLGYDVEVVDHEVAWSLYFQDPDGNPYEIISHDHRAVAALQSLPGT